MDVAILMTCFNRVNKTLQCLNSLHEAMPVVNVNFTIFLVDDNSPDKTGEIIKQQFPQINVIMSSGNLFWGGGTNLAWEKAAEKKKFNYFLWLNDDVVLFKNAFKILFRDKKWPIDTLTIGIFQSSDKNKTNLTYGARDENLELISPKEINKKAKFIDGNFVLIPNEIFQKIGLIDPIFYHNYGDADYGLRVLKNNFKIRHSSDILGICELNPKEKWQSTEASLLERFRDFRSSKNTGIRQMITFQYRHFGLFGVIRNMCGVIIMIINPNIYFSIKKK